VTGTAFRTRMPCISNDYLADERGRCVSPHNARDRRPIQRGFAPAQPSEAFGVLNFISSESNAFYALNSSNFCSGLAEYHVPSSRWGISIGRTERCAAEEQEAPSRVCSRR